MVAEYENSIGTECKHFHIEARCSHGNSILAFSPSTQYTIFFYTNIYAFPLLFVFIYVTTKTTQTEQHTHITFKLNRLWKESSNSKLFYHQHIHTHCVWHAIGKCVCVCVCAWEKFFLLFKIYLGSSQKVVLLVKYTNFMWKWK